MDEATIQTLLLIGTPEQFQKGDYICHQGSPGDKLYMVLGGKVEAHRQSMNDESVLVDTYECGNFFGEMALLEDELCDASYIAAEPTVCVAIHRSHISDMLKTCPELSVGLLKDLGVRLRDLRGRIYHAETQTTEVHIQPFSIPKGFREHPIPGVRFAADKYLIKTNNLCPVCGKPIIISHLRMNELMCVRVLNSQRHIYNGCEILWHYIWKCKRCGYANFHTSFFKKPAVNQAMILRLVSMQNQILMKIQPRHPIDEIILDYYRAINYNESLNSSNIILIGKLWRYLCWIYSDADDLEMANFCRDKALYYYRYVNQKRQDLLVTEEARQQCAMIVAELYLEKGEFDKARPFYDEVIKYRGRVLAQKAYDRLFEIMED